LELREHLESKQDDEKGADRDGAGGVDGVGENVTEWEGLSGYRDDIVGGYGEKKKSQ
jgi:hypothetical protein